MNLRPKTVRRLLLLSLVGVLVLGSAFSLFVVRQWQNQRVLETHRAEGLAAFQEGDYYNTLEKASFYLRRGRQDDAEVLYALAEARRRLDEPDGRHLAMAIPLYRLYLQLRPDDDEVRRTLLSTYNEAGYLVEARDLAATLRPDDLSEAGPEHLKILREEALALMGTREFGPRLEAVLGRIFELDPLDVYGQMVQLDVFRHTDQRQEARRWGNRVLEEFPDDPRSVLVYGASRLIHPTTDEIGIARRRLSEAAGIDPATGERVRVVKFSDAEHVRQLVELLDRLRAFNHALEVLQAAAQDLDDVHLHRTLARRLWQDGRHAEVVALTEGLDAALRESDAQLLGLRALALASLGEADEAMQIAAALEKREGDFRGEAWAKAIPQVVQPERKAHVEAISSLRAAVNVNPIEPIIRVMLGDRLNALDRTEEARRAWTDAAQLEESASWPAPWVKVAESFLAEGRVEEAFVAAESAMQIAPNRLAVNVVWIEAQAMRIYRGSGGGTQATAVLARLERTLEQLGRTGERTVAADVQDRLLSSRLVLLARTGRHNEARHLVQSVLEREVPPGPQLLHRIVAVGVAEGVLVDETVTGRVEALEGGSAALVESRAHRLAAEGRVEAGLELLRNAAGEEPDVEAQLVLARYLDATDDPGAPGAWKRLGDEHPDNLTIQRACLRAYAAAADPEFIQRTIERYLELQGREADSEDVVIRLARARTLLHGRPTRRMRDEAVGILASVVSSQPMLVEARILLASALAMSDRERHIAPDLSRAVSHLTEAARLEPHNAAIRLDLARVLARQGEHQRAREQLLHVIRNARTGLMARQIAAERLLQAGDHATARDVLADLVERLGEEAPAQLLLLLARAHQQSGEMQTAAALYDRLARGGVDDAEAIVATAIHFAQRDEKERARHVMDQLERLELAHAERDFAAAQFEARAGDPVAATELFERSLAADPDRPHVWWHFAEMHLRKGNAGRAAEIAARALEVAPHDSALSILRARAEVLAAGDLDPSLSPLVEAMATDEAFAGARRILAAIETAREAGDLENVDGLRRLASRFPDSFALQMYVAGRLAAMDPAAAVTTAQRAMNIDQQDPAPARLAVELFRSLGRWNDMLAAARSWRERSGASTAGPDLAIAEAYLRMGRTQRTLSALAPHLEEALAAPEESRSLAVIDLRARALVESRRVEEARQLLVPLLAETADVRTRIWLDIAASALPSLDESRRWLRELEAHVPVDATDERLAVAAARVALADRFAEQGPDLLGQARLQLEELAASAGPAAAGAWEMLGVVRAELGDTGGAEEAYRRAVELDESRAVALNNLAIIVAQTQGDLEEAARLAQRAVAAWATPDATHLSTLAGILRERGDQLHRAGEHAAAEASFRAAAAAWGELAARQGGEAVPLIQAAQALWRAGDPEAAATEYQRALAVGGLSGPIEAAVWNNLAAALRAAAGSEEQLDQAYTAVQEALQRSERAEFYATLGWIEVDRSAPEAARRAFDRAVELAGEIERIPAAGLGLAWLMRHTGDVDRSEVEGLLAKIQPRLGDEYADRLKEVQAALAEAGAP